MLSKEANEQLTRVGPDTPGGRLLRRYWHPIAPSADLPTPAVRKVRHLGEDLILYRDRSGVLGLVAERCPHRRTSLALGIPELHGLRCSYHGWLFDETGSCVEQPCEPVGSTFKDRVRATAYRVEELGGLIFAYLGPEPAPLLPRYEFLVWDNVVRHMGVTVLPCNWLQCMENSVDPMHVEWLHGRFLEYAWEQQGRPLGIHYTARTRKFGFDRFEFGIMKRRIMENEPDDVPSWTHGHNPLLFPNVACASGRAFAYRVPIDDTHTYHIQYSVYRTGLPAERQTTVPAYDINLTDDYGRMMTGILLVQDFAAFVEQGAISDRENEHLGQSDTGVIMYRELLREQIDRVARGEDPIGIVREPPAGGVIPLPVEGDRAEIADSKRFQSDWFEETLSPLRDELVKLHTEAERRMASGELVKPSNAGDFVPLGEHHRQVTLFPPRTEAVGTA